jgi:hypothetical protein
MFTLFKVFMAKCILITFLYQSNKQSSKYQDGKMAKYPSKIVMAWSQHMYYEGDKYGSA